MLIPNTQRRSNRSPTAMQNSSDGLCAGTRLKSWIVTDSIWKCKQQENHRMLRIRRPAISNTNNKRQQYQHEIRIQSTRRKMQFFLHSRCSLLHFLSVDSIAILFLMIFCGVHSCFSFSYAMNAIFLFIYDDRLVEVSSHMAFALVTLPIWDWNKWAATGISIVLDCVCARQSHWYL